MWLDDIIHSTCFLSDIKLFSISLGVYYKVEAKDYHNCSVNFIQFYIGIRYCYIIKKSLMFGFHTAYLKVKLLKQHKVSIFLLAIALLHFGHSVSGCMHDSNFYRQVCVSWAILCFHKVQGFRLNQGQKKDQGLRVYVVC